MSSRWFLVLVVLGVFTSGCPYDVEYYCDDTNPCLPRYPDRPHCDVAGNYGAGIGNTCVPNPYDAGVIDGMTEADASVADASIADAEPLECTEAADCDDDKFCTGIEDCVDNKCVEGTPPDCGDSVGCTVDSCDTVADECTNLPDHDACSDPNAPFCDETVDCRDAPCTNSTQCDDGKFCNGAETCDIPTGETVGSCVGGDTPNCADAVDCTVDTCSTGLNKCANTPDPAPCNNNKYCDGEETCHQTLGCQSGTKPDPSDGVACTEWTCDEDADEVTHEPDHDFCTNSTVCDGAETCDRNLGCQMGTALSCDNGKYCDGAETCDDTFGCQTGPAPPTNDGVTCTVDGCDETNGVTHEPNHGSCSNGLYCDGAEVCHETQGCQPGTSPDVNDGVSCTLDSCDEINDRPLNTPQNSVCDNKQKCDGDETCHPTQDCQAGTPLSCDNGLYCDGLESCDDTAGCQLGTPPVCDNGLYCDGVETCDNDTASCLDGTSIDCGPNDVCKTNYTCDEGTDMCNLGTDIFRPVTWKRIFTGSIGSGSVKCSGSLVAFTRTDICRGKDLNFQCSIDQQGRLNANSLYTGPYDVLCLGNISNSVTSGCTESTDNQTGETLRCCFQ